MQINPRRLIFEPGEQIKLTINPALPETSFGSLVNLAVELRRSRRGDTQWQHDEERLAVPVDGNLSTAVTVPLPTDNGVYTIHVRVTPPPALQFGFGRTPKPLATRELQVVVLNKQAGPRPGSPDAWREVHTMDPTNPRWWQKLPQWTQLHRLIRLTRRRTVESTDPNVVRLASGKFVELPPPGADRQPHWQAYVLPIETVGRAHLVEVEYPADQEIQLGFAVIEPNAQGEIVSAGRTSGVFIDKFATSAAGDIHRHRLLFWPQTRSPVLVITNDHPHAVAHFGAIHVLVEAPQDNETIVQPASGAGPPERLVATYLAEPAFAAAFGASQAIDARTGQSINDLQTFYEGSERLAYYLRHSGYNAAVVTVSDSAGTIYPSQFAPRPQDAATTDAPAVDPLELLLQLSDGRGLSIIPAIDFTFALPAVDAGSSLAEPKQNGMPAGSAAGVAWDKADDRSAPPAPRYNLLRADVQDAMLHMVQEAMDRYGRHQSLGGLAIKLSGQGYAQLAPLDWGLDDAVVDEFERETGVDLAGESSNMAAARRAALLGKHQQAWLKWRIARVTEFYDRVASVVRESDHRRRLILTTESLFALPAVERQVRPAILRRIKLDALMLEMGIDPQQLGQIPGLVLLRPHFVAPTAPLVDHAIQLEINAAPELLESFSTIKSSPGVLVYHAAKPAHFASLDVPAAIADDDVSTSQLTNHVPDHAASRRPLVEALSTSDPHVLVDGGRLPSAGQEQSLRRVLQIVQQLPIHIVDTKRQPPIVVRTLQHAGSRTVCLINESSWPVDARLTLDVPTAAQSSLLYNDPSRDAGDFPAQRNWHPGLHALPVRLEPFDVCAVRFDRADVRVTGLDVHVPAKAKTELAARINDLKQRELTSRDKCRYTALVNPGFEPLAGERPIPGWRSSAPAGAAKIELNTSQPLAGTSCLYMESGSRSAVIKSDDFAIPQTGQLALTVWVRAENVAPETQLRMVFVAEGDRPQPAVVGGGVPGAPPLQSQWAPYAFGVQDLPLDSDGQMHVRLELVGPGQVWVDAVELYQLLFPLDFYQQSERQRFFLVKMLHAAHSALENGEVADCQRLLDSYWPRFLDQYLPPADQLPAAEDAQVAEQPSEPGEVQNDQKQQTPPRPTMSERIRGWLWF